MKKRIIVAFSLLCVALFFGSMLFVLNIRYNEQIYPNYIQHQPKITYENQYYSIELTSYITKLDIYVEDVTAYYNIFTCEENYQGDWELELVTNQTIHKQGKNTLIKTESFTPTFLVQKYWVFSNDSRTFTLELKKTYKFESENINNQIIVDVENDGVYTNFKDWVVFDTDFGFFGVKVIDSNCDVSLQMPRQNATSLDLKHVLDSPDSSRYTEVQVNIDGQKDRDLRSHYEGQTEIVKFLCFAYVESYNMPLIDDAIALFGTD